MAQEDIAELFLLDFMNSLIEAKYSEIGMPKVRLVEPKFDTQKLIVKPRQKIEMLNKPIQMKKVPEVLPVEKPVKKTPIQFNYSVSSEQISATDKLNSLMRDPHVNEIECLGADSPLIVKKSGMPQKTQVNLSVDEVYELIAEFSQKTRIPIINGRIKAALNDLIITAVLSENLGPRFIIQKKLRPLVI